MVEEFVAIPTLTPGEVLCKWVKVPHSVNYALEHALAGTEDWHNGDYFAGEKLLMTGLPSGQDVKLRISAIGSRNRRSTWKQVETLVF